jgi:hypothetical protein
MDFFLVRKKSYFNIRKKLVQFVLSGSPKLDSDMITLQVVPSDRLDVFDALDGCPPLTTVPLGNGTETTSADLNSGHECGSKFVHVALPSAPLLSWSSGERLQQNVKVVIKGTDRGRHIYTVMLAWNCGLAVSAAI